jgi:dCMP deaminase
VTRPTWDETWARVALVMAQRSRCSRAKIGAVIVSPQNRIVATGYNGPPRHWFPTNHRREHLNLSDDCRDWCPRARGMLEWGDKRSLPIEAMKQVAFGSSYDNCPANHAEINALMYSERFERESGCIYVTGSVCMACAKAIGNSGLSAVVLVNVDREADAHRDPEKVEKFMSDCGLAVIDVRVD